MPRFIFIVLFFFNSVSCYSLELQGRAKEAFAGYGDEAIEFDFSLKNNLAVSDSIKAVHRDCTCIDIRFSEKVILPGECAIVHVKIKPSRKQGLSKQSIIIETTQSKSPVEIPVLTRRPVVLKFSESGCTNSDGFKSFVITVDKSIASGEICIEGFCKWFVWTSIKNQNLVLNSFPKDGSDGVSEIGKLIVPLKDGGALYEYITMSSLKSSKMSD